MLSREKKAELVARAIRDSIADNTMVGSSIADLLNDAETLHIVALAAIEAMPEEGYGGVAIGREDDVEMVARAIYATLHHLMRETGTVAQAAYEQAARAILSIPTIKERLDLKPIPDLGTQDRRLEDGS